MRSQRAIFCGLLIGLLTSAASSAAQTPPAVAPTPSAPPIPPVYVERKPPTAPSKVEKVSPTQVRVGAVRVDLAAREVSVDGLVNDVPQLEFLVNTKNGYKSYESAIEAECNGIDFNLALILVGLDRDRARNQPRFHFDPLPPQGDAVEIWVSWKTPAGPKRVPASDLLYNWQSREVLAASNWVYTGSQFFPGTRAFLADVDGVLIGFVHTPAPLIERAETVPGQFGNIRLNPNLGLTAGTPVTVTVRALTPPKK